MNIETKISQALKVFTTNSTSASITAPAATLTEPVGSGVVDLRSGIKGPNFGELIFYGAGADNNTASVAVYLWLLVGKTWIPIQVLGLDLALSTAVGVSGGDVLDTERFVDTIASTAGAPSVSSADVLSPANNTPGKIVFDLQGAQKVEVRVNKGTATNMNALFRGF